ncbi:MAG: response regulator [bacterium]
MITNNKSILVLEDEQPLLDAVRIKLEKEGYHVVTARSVTQAFSYLEEGVQVDAVWLDHYLLGKEDGLDFVAKIKEEDSAWKNLPIFVVSNTASSDKVKSYLHLGVTQYYTKANYRLEQIIDDIKKVLN